MRASNTLQKKVQYQCTRISRLPKPNKPLPRFHNNILVFDKIKEYRLWRGTPKNHLRIALVPTMGALHEGHLALIRAAARRATHVIVSVYVNPAQFGISEDLASYPVTWDTDVEKLKKLDLEMRQAENGTYKGRIKAILAPSTAEMYPSGFPGQEVDSKGTFVTVTPASDVLEGASRPTFFRGVATVCMKLFNIVQPHCAFFGRKDVQQTVVVRKMCRDLHIPTTIVVCDTVREPDGLAMSSRNVYLGTRRRAVAIVLRQALLAAEKQFQSGERSRAAILGAAEDVFGQVQEEQDKLGPTERVKFRVDYLSLSDPEAMQEVDSVPEDGGAILSCAIYMEKIEEANAGEDLGHSDGPMVRLLDNIILGDVDAEETSEAETASVVDESSGSSSDAEIKAAEAEIKAIEGEIKAAEEARK